LSFGLSAAAALQSILGQKEDFFEKISGKKIIFFNDGEAAR
jgi:hypothetical protein